MKTEFGAILVRQVMELEIGDELSIDGDFINEVQSALCSQPLGGRRFKAASAPDGVNYVLCRLAEEKVAVDIETTA